MGNDGGLDWAVVQERIEFTGFKRGVDELPVGAEILFGVIDDDANRRGGEKPIHVQGCRGDGLSDETGFEDE